MINLLHVGAFCYVWVLFSRTVLPRPAILWAVRRRKAPTRPDSHPQGGEYTPAAMDGSRGWPPLSWPVA